MAPVMVGLLLPLAMALPSAAGEEPVRCAFVTQPDSRARLVADLCLAALREEDGLAFVERDRIDAAVAEQALARVLASQACSLVRELGTLLAADRLVILSDETGPGVGKRVDVRVCDSRTGARLAYGRFPDGAGIEQLQAEIAPWVAGTLNRYRTIRRLVVVPPFLSRDFLYRFDHLRQSYAEVARSAFSGVPDTAVLETDAARALAEEVAVGALDFEAGALPCIFVNGSFGIVTSNDVVHSALELVIHSATDEAKSEVRDTVPLAEAPALIEKAVGRAMYSRRMCVRSPSAAERLSRFVERAEDFARLAFYRESACLYESALLLDDSRTELRIALIALYARLADEGCFPLSQANVAANFRQAHSDYLRAYDHIEVLIRRRDVTREKAVQFVRMVNLRRARGSADSWVKYHGLDFDLESLAPPWEFFLTTYPRVWDLESEKVDWMAQSPDALLINRTALWFTAHPPEEAEWEILQRLFTRALGGAFRLHQVPSTPEDGPFDGEQISRTAEHLVNLGKAGARHRDFARHYRTFLKALANVGTPPYKFLAAYGEIMHAISAAPESLSEEHLKTVHSLRRWIDTVDLGPPRRTSVGYRRVIREFLDTAERRINPVKVAARRAPAAAGKKDDAPASGYDSLGAPFLTAKRAEITVRTLTGKTMPLEGKRWRASGGWTGVQGVLACDRSLDVFWAPCVLLFMHRKGLLEEVLLQKGLRITDVKWDGAHLWVVTPGHGVHVLDRKGRTLHVFDEKDGLPPGCQMVVLDEAGDAFLAGSFGRGWVARARYSEDARSVDVFYKAIEVPLDSEWHSAAERASLKNAFFPTWATLARLPGDDHDSVVIGRNPLARAGRAGAEGAARGPIGVNPLTLELRALSAAMWPPHPRAFCWGGDLFQINSDSMRLWDVGKRQVVDHREVRGRLVRNGTDRTWPREDHTRPPVV